MPRSQLSTLPIVPRPVVKPRGFRAPSYELSLADYLAAGGEGNSQLERLVDGAARRLGIYFDERQKWLPLTFGFEKTIADYWISSPPMAIFVDGIQHTLRPETAQDDLVKRMQLESMGIKVIVITWKELIENPMAAVSKIWYEL